MGLYALMMSLTFATLSGFAGQHVTPNARGWHEQLVQASRARDISNADKLRLLRTHFVLARDDYDRLRTLDLHDVRTLFQAADLMFSYSLVLGDPAVASDAARLEATFDELGRRDAVTDSEARILLGVQLSMWYAAKAKALQARFPQLASVVVPELASRPVSPRAPAYVDLGRSGDRATLRTTDLTRGIRIVIVSGCKNAERAAASVWADPELRSAFEKGSALWLAPASKDLDVGQIQAWNRAHPGQPMMVSAHNAAWVGVDFARIPTTYVYVDGRIVASHRGWNVDGTVPDGLRRSLQETGLLPDH
ncbi:hypothetical protein [Montanilutibacter psychrotolerans]|uniref:Uncharacterized protein n=1 Tax=Montanilutibacter psychrotolerans TaxID=1327343 RepID=A0A3M8SYE0_9GAMM|nr:hypothetical protein [Lysobacter psychrotolerans]RNF86259.1 hypothetical protein EER27_02210 [Lysobacter psychrotolerans]